jgi:hypothetical protein
MADNEKIDYVLKPVKPAQMANAKNLQHTDVPVAVFVGNIPITTWIILLSELLWRAHGHTEVMGVKLKKPWTAREAEPQPR